MNKQLNKRGIVRLWLVQTIIAVVFMILCVFAYDLNAGFSAWLGSVVCIVPNAYFASRLFKYQGAGSAKKIVNSFYKGEAFKIVISILLFSMVFLVFRITPLAFFLSYIMILMTHWFTPWIIFNKQNRPESD